MSDYNPDRPNDSTKRSTTVPLFEYQCQACQAVEEVLAKHKDPPPKVCESCGKKGKMEKVVSLTSFQLKGGGWYKDLYSSVPKSDGASDSASTSTSTSESAPAKSETKTKKKASKSEKKATTKKAS